MTILFSKEILSVINNELKNATESVQIISAYCKMDAFKTINTYIPSKITKKRIMIRFRLDDLLSGSTDFEVLRFCMCFGWEVYIRFDLHAKTYVIDNKRCMLGSANITKNGLNINKLGNTEMTTLFNMDKSDVTKIENLFNHSIRVDVALLHELEKQYHEFKMINQIPKEHKSWDRKINSLFNPHIDILFTHELPSYDKIELNTYIEFLDNTFYNIEALKDSFRWSNSYMWLLETLKNNNGEMYFGELTQKLHSVIINDPKPFRKEVKILLHNLLYYTEKLEMDEITIDRPNYSQRIRLNLKV